MKRNIMIYGCMLLLIMGLFPFESVAHAEDNVSEVQEKRKDIKDKLSEQEKELADNLIEMDKLEKEVKDLEQTLEANQSEIKKAEKEIDQVKEEIKEIEEKIEERFDILRERAKAFQENGGDIGYLDVLFESNSFNELISRVTMVTKIADADADLIEQQKEDKKKVDKRLKDLEGLKEELNVIKRNIEDQKENKEAKKKDLQTKQDNITALTDELEMKDEELSNLQSKLMVKEVQQDISSPTKSVSQNKGNGAFTWPTDGGYVSSPTGKRWGKQHKGIDIARTDRSTNPPIYAADSGTVEIAGFNNGGYGNRVIIDHGNGVKTLYGHMSKLNVSSGQQVKAGQQIGVMGSTGQSTGVHLHFEVHVNGSIQNPLTYL